MNKAIFNENHKSYYIDTDIEILNECRTIVPCGFIKKPEVEKNIAEIDINKAFTKAFTSIKRIPIFRQFDIWRKWNKTCNIDDMHNLSLFMVEAQKASMIFNKKRNLIYGKYLKKLVKRGVKCDILYYRQPSYIHKVDNGKVIDDLWAEQISNEQQEDRRIKKNNC